MSGGVSPVRGLCSLLVWVLFAASPFPAIAQTAPQTAAELAEPGSSSAQPMELTADRLTVNRETEVYKADGSVILVQGSTRLTADHLTFNMLTGDLLATGRVHLARETTDVWADRLELNINTEAGVIFDGKLFDKDTNSLITGRKVQRYSEDHYRANEGSFTNCDAMEGQTPDWRFRFEDVDLMFGDSIQLKNAWFCVYDVPILPIPYFRYPMVRRKTGFLLPTPGWNSEFGFTYRQGFFWAIDPSQDMTITPFVLSERGYGGDVEYRYMLSRQHKGQWLLNGLQDTDQDRTRGFIRGSHTLQTKEGFSLRAKAFLLTDPSYPQDFANSGVLRALPSAENTLNIRQQLRQGSAYVLTQYFQPVDSGGATSFQRLPEVGLQLRDLSLFGGPLLWGFDGAGVNWWREEGFDLGRLDLMPTLTTKPIYLGHMIGVTPSVKPRFLVYSRGRDTKQVVNRETVWASLRLNSRLRRRFRDRWGGTLLHAIEPDVTYEYVPDTAQTDIVQVDAVDDLPKKHLLTYRLRTQLTKRGGRGASGNWLDLTLAQSYQVELPPGADPLLLGGAGGVSANLRRRFSNVWIKGSSAPVFGRSTNLALSVDAFFDPYDVEFSQFNSDFQFQYQSMWYAGVGQRFSRRGTRVRRGDIWNPLSLGQVFVSDEEISFVTGTVAVRLPYGFTVGSRIYQDIQAGETQEWDVVGLYQNPCRCWSLGAYFINFPDRTQYSVLLTLRGLGSTDSLGTQLLKSILGPLLRGEKGLPW